MEDSLQTTYFAKSLYVIAREIGLPLHFVQLRHAATHEDLPSLPVLRNAGIEVSISSKHNISTHSNSCVGAAMAL
jgi:hypothetical protein